MSTPLPQASILAARRVVMWLAEKCRNEFPEASLDLENAISMKIKEQKVLNMVVAKELVKVLEYFFRLFESAQQDGSQSVCRRLEGLDHLRALGRILLQIDLNENSKSYAASSLFIEAVRAGPARFLREKAECIMALYHNLPIDKAQSLRMDLWRAIIATAKEADGEFPKAVVIAADPEVLGKEILTWNECSLKEKSAFFRDIARMLLECAEEPQWASSYARMAVVATPSCSESIALYLEATIKDEKTIFYDAVMNLINQKDLKNGAELIKAMDLLISGSVADMKAFTESDDMKKLTARDISSEQLLTKLRMALIVSHEFDAQKLGGQKATISALSAAVDATESETEAMVAQSITRGLMVGRIHQISKEVVWSNCQPRQFQKEGGLDALSAKLEKLIDATGSALTH